MKTIEFKGSDRQKWVHAASEAGWAEVIERSPKHGPALKKLFTRYNYGKQISKMFAMSQPLYLP